ncbi:hypothetical protein AAFC00_005780 [Neodothiora populina]|uniref:Tafazzin family protein n=1 Tax=Neodothiora populina TaxID=2781224 RepID=A0ABR3P5U0_9PEZI
MASSLLPLPDRPSLGFRIASTFQMGWVGTACRSFLLAFNRLEVNGWDGFKKLLDEREDVAARQRGLITVSNHTSVLDDPALWGALPYSYHWNPDSLRWSLASHDLAFQSRFTSFFFTIGNTLPCHRAAHSPYGGLFQPTMTQAIRLLSNGPFAAPPVVPSETSLTRADIPDPFSDSQLTYSTNGQDSFPAPSAYANRRFAWVHIFPEGKVHQKTDKTMRYFKWGVSRLILEADTVPDLVPIWIEGFDSVMHESRTFPRFIPRGNNDVSVTFGEKVDMEARFGDLRSKWQQLKAKVPAKAGQPDELGVIRDIDLMTGHEAVELRKECTMRVREEVLKVRRGRGLPDEDPKCGLVETWREEAGAQQGLMGDGSYVKDM